VPLSPEDSAPLYVEMMGGAERIIARGQELFNAGDYLLAMEIVNKLVHAEPENQAGKDLLADIFEQLGYQAECGGHRNSYLAAAYELRSGIPQGAMVSASPDVVRAMSTELFLNFLGIKMDSRKAEGLSFTMNLVTPDTGETFLIELSNATLNNLAGYRSDDADLTLTINRADLELTMAGAQDAGCSIADGTAQVEGDLSPSSAKLAGLMVDFDPRFEIMPGTKLRTEVDRADAFEAAVGAVIPE
jgi:alkyl sulfatase BDS1-like metallo-beta-lactamase superfamily hydrolase